MRGKRAVLAALAVGLGLTLGVARSAPEVAAQQAPPENGPVVLEDPLSSPGVAQLLECASRRNATGFQGGAYFLAVTGRCQASSIGASISTPIEGLTLADGEVAVGVRVLAGPERARFNLIVREQSVWSTGAYVAQVEPGRGVASLVRWANGQPTVLAERRDLAALFQPGGLNRVALRTLGPDLWLLIDDQPILAASDAAYGVGTVRLQLERVGSLEDQQPALLVLQDLRVSGPVVGGPGRPPLYRRPGLWGRPADGPGRATPDEGSNHIGPGVEPGYVNSPPASGPHYPVWTRPGVYAESQRPGNWVHSLEHGYVVLLYNCPGGCPELVQQLTAFYEAAPRSARYGFQKLIVQPWPGLEHRLAAVAWDRLDELDDFDADRLGAFFQAYQDAGPEDAP